jgi:hypothetical protein
LQTNGLGLVESNNVHGVNPVADAEVRRVHPIPTFRASACCSAPPTTRQ